MFWQFFSELHLILSFTRRYWFDHLGSLVASVLLFYAFALGLGRFGMGAGLATGALLLMYAAYTLVSGVFNSIANSITSDLNRGTLEHIALARGGLMRQLGFRALGDLLYALVWTGLILASLLLLTGIRLQPAPWWPLGALPLVLAAFGFALGMGGLALYFKRVGSVFTIVDFLFLPYFFSLVRFEPWMAYLPFAPGVQLLRLGLTGERLPLDLVGLALLQGLLFLALGFGALAWIYALVRHQGILGRY